MTYKESFAALRLAVEEDSSLPPDMREKICSNLPEALEHDIGEALKANLALYRDLAAEMIEASEAMKRAGPVLSEDQLERFLQIIERNGSRLVLIANSAVTPLFRRLILLQILTGKVDPDVFRTRLRPSGNNPRT